MPPNAMIGKFWLRKVLIKPDRSKHRAKELRCQFATGGGEIVQNS